MQEVTPYVVTGRTLLGEDLREEDVAITVSAGIITSIEPYPGMPDRWIVPALFNAHTHLGDTVAMDLPARGSLADLVKPPGGLKHRILAATPRAELVLGMRSSIMTMIATGTAGFADFREGGPTVWRRSARLRPGSTAGPSSSAGKAENR
jgi:Cytosine deaminase and related metal-dependent hydrolases